MQFIEWCAVHKNGLIIAAVAVALLVVIIGLIIGVHKRKKKRSAKGKIYKTTDGFLGNYPPNKKTRRVAAIDQRKTDGALAVVKITKKRGKENKSRKNIVPNLELSPDEHNSLTETSLVIRQVIIGVKDGETFKPIYIRDLEKTDDKLTRRELIKIMKSINDTPQHRKSHKNKMRRWRRGFKGKRK